MSTLRVVANDEVHLASRVAKRDTTLPSAFASVNGGAVGRVVEDQLWLQNRPANERPAPLPRPGRTDHHVLVVEGGLDEHFRFSISWRIL